MTKVIMDIVSTRVEVNRSILQAPCNVKHCLHARGGEPQEWIELHEHVLLSPRAWR